MLTFTACSENSSPTGPDTNELNQWQEDDSYFRNSKILMNAHVNSDSTSFIVAGLNDIVLYKTTGDSVTWSRAFNNDLLNSKPAISDEYVAYSGSGSLQFTINSPFYWIGSRYTASFPFYHEFQLGDTPYYSSEASIPDLFGQKPMGAFNENEQFLTVISDTSKFSDTNISLALVNLNPSRDEMISENPLLEFNPKVQRITYPVEVSSYISHIASFDNNFYASINADLIRVTPDGSMQKASGINSRVHDMFAHDDTLFAYTGNSNSIHISLDEGRSWSPYIEQFPIDQPNFFYMDNTLCFYVYSQIAKIDMNKEEIVELDNSGIEGDEITSVNKFNGRVWITTLSGMFFKPVSSFFTVKEQSEETRAKKGEGIKVIK